jgi:mRNA interferase RelE/StbE
MAPARRQLDRLPVSVAAAVLETLAAIASNPRRLGKPLRFELEGCFSARRGPYRVIYRIDDTTPHTVSVLAVAHRADIYRPR